MRIVHMADLHLGYTAYPYVTSQGRNRREVDVMETFRRVVSRINEIAPDAVVVGGDIFHTPRPTPQVVLDAIRGFASIRVPVFAAAGNHDLSRSGGGCVLDLLQESVPSFTAATIGPRSVGAGDEWITMVPDGHGANTPSGVLVLHGEVSTMPNAGAGALRPEELSGWTYVALGHYHIRTEIAPMIWYSGSIDYTSSDIWKEARSGVPKGVLLVDTEERTVTPVDVPVARPVISLPDVDGTDLSFGEIHDRLAWEPVPGAIVRRVVREIDPVVAREFTAKHRRDLKGSALHYQLDLDKARPERQAVTKRRSLAEMLADRLAKANLSPEEMDRLVALNTTYMTQAEQQEDTNGLR